MPDCRDCGASDAAQEITDKRRRAEERTGRDLPHGHGIKQLTLGKPAESLDDIGAQKRNEHIPASEKDRANPGENQKQGP